MRSPALDFGPKNRNLTPKMKTLVGFGPIRIDRNVYIFEPNPSLPPFNKVNFQEIDLKIFLKTLQNGGILR